MHKGGINKCYPPRITTEPQLVYARERRFRAIRQSIWTAHQTKPMASTPPINSIIPFYISQNKNPYQSSNECSLHASDLTGSRIN